MVKGNKENKRVNYKWQALSELIMMIALLVIVNLICSRFFFRLDMTKENRYSLSDASKTLASKVNEVMTVKVYLEGEFPSGFKHLSKSTKEMLDEFAAYSNGNIQYEFIDPFANADSKKTTDIVSELVSKGLQPTNVQIKKDDEMAQKIIVPGALVYYKGKEYPVNLLKGQFGAAPEEVINSSIELLEYEIANMIRKATERSRKKIAFTEDHGELEKWEVADAQAELGQYYEVNRIPLSSVPPQELNKYAGIVIAKPSMPFSDYDKFKLDQYVMNGGKIIWIIDSQIADMDSLQKEPMFVSASYDLNLDDILFRYGVRVNPNLVQDIQCEAIPVLSSLQNGNPQQKLLPWLFFPVAEPACDHPVVKNIDPVWFQFASSIDTTSTQEIHKTVLLRTSPYARLIGAPVRVDLGMVRIKPDPEMFSRGSYPLAVLLEGKFKSIFKYRMNADREQSLPFTAEINSNRMIVISDGDVIRNQRKKSTGEIYPLGYDRYTNQQFGNKRFILNCADFLCDDSGILEIRSKEITLRLLNKAKVKSEKLKWQLINTIIPVVMVLLFGATNQWIRRRKYIN